MQKYRIKFRIGDIFSPNDTTSRRIICLFMIYNDLMFIGRLVNEKSSTISDTELFYIFRLHCSHLWEAVKKLRALSKSSKFKKIKERLSDSAKISFEKLEKEYTPLHHSFADKVLKEIRNSFFHYMSTAKIKSALKKIGNQYSKIILGEKRVDMHFEVADEVIGNNLIRTLKEAGYNIENAEDIKPVYKRITDMNSNFLNFFEGFLEIYFELYMKGKYTEKKIRNNVNINNNSIIPPSL